MFKSQKELECFFLKKCCSTCFLWLIGPQLCFLSWGGFSSWFEKIHLEAKNGHAHWSDVGKVIMYFRKICSTSPKMNTIVIFIHCTVYNREVANVFYDIKERSRKNYIIFFNTRLTIFSKKPPLGLFCFFFTGCLFLLHFAVVSSKKITGTMFCFSLLHLRGETVSSFCSRLAISYC